MKGEREREREREREYLESRTQTAMSQYSPLDRAGFWIYYTPHNPLTSDY
jgi:hypothetical protein